MTREDLLIQSISTEKAILFTGAGFSYNCKNLQGRNLDQADQLSIEISKLGNFEDDPDNKDLRYTADYYISQKNPQKLVQYLLDNFTVQSVTDTQISICKLPWKRFYTTNYDNSIEQSLASSSKPYYTINTTEIPSEHLYKSNLCIHLNGSISDLTVDKLDNEFKLSNSSYVAPDSFLSSPWARILQEDLDKCSAVVFVGYSLYDIDIQRILKTNPNLKEKVFFIIKPNPTKKEQFTLEKYGTVLAIGADGFAEILKRHENYFSKKRDYILSCFEEYSPPEKPANIEDKDFEAFILYGEENPSIINTVVYHNPKPFISHRAAIQRIISSIEGTHNVIISSDLGNGKSVLLRYLTPLLSQKGYNIFRLEDDYGDYAADIQHIQQNFANAILVIDGYQNHIRVIEYLAEIKPPGLRIIATIRSAIHERYVPKFNDNNFQYHEHNIDTLTTSDLSSLTALFTHYGYWRHFKGSWNEDQKLSFLRTDCQSQFAQILLNLFDAPQIRDKLKLVLQSLLKNNEEKSTIFSIALLGFLDIRIIDNVVNLLSNNDLIYSPRFTQSTEFKNIFKKEGAYIKNKSMPFSQSIIKHFFPASFTIERLFFIARTTNEHKKTDRIYDELFRATLRFSIIEKLLPDYNKPTNLFRYYQDLKNYIPWLSKDPHYWLQFGMAYMSNSDYEKAQEKLETAYSLARQKSDYTTQKIDNQQAKLFFLQAMKESDNAKIYDLTRKGFNILIGQDNDIYKYRQLELLTKVYEKSFLSLSRTNKIKFLTLCRNLKTQIDKNLTGQANDTQLSRKMTSIQKALTSILNQNNQ